MFHCLLTAVKLCFKVESLKQIFQGRSLIPQKLFLATPLQYWIPTHSYMHWICTHTVDKLICAGRFVCKSYNLSTSPTQFWATDCKFTSDLRWNKLDTHYSLLKWTIIWNMTVWTGSCARATMFQLLLHSSERQTASLSVACGGTSWTLTMTLIYTPHSSSQINCQHHLWKNTCRSINQSINCIIIWTILWLCYDDVLNFLNIVFKL